MRFSLATIAFHRKNQLKCSHQILSSQGKNAPSNPYPHYLKSGQSKWGLSKWGLKVLVHNCPRLPTIVVILRRKFSLERGPKRPQKCTIVDDCVQIAESGLKPPFESPHLDFPEFSAFSNLKVFREEGGGGGCTCWGPPRPEFYTPLPQGPCHTKNTTVIVIHYGGFKTLRR